MRPFVNAFRRNAFNAVHLKLNAALRWYAWRLVIAVIYARICRSGGPFDNNILTP
jgi:hypothetical protein